VKTEVQWFWGAWWLFWIGMALAQLDTKLERVAVALETIAKKP
jgi:hypothetical protein